MPADVIERMDAVADFAYRADGSPTPLAAAALAAGLPVVDGLELLVRQGALSFRALDGRRAAARRHAPRGAGRMSATVAALAAVGGGLGALALGAARAAPDRARGGRRGAARAAAAGRARSRPGRCSCWSRRSPAAPSGWRFGATRELIPALVLAFALVGISAIDLRYRIIPDRITLPLAVAGLVLAAVLDAVRPARAAARGLRRGRLPADRGAALARRDGHGRRQARVRARAVPRPLGRRSRSSSASSARSSRCILLLPRHGLRARKMHLALGPFLALGGMVALLAGDDIISWYTGG